MSKSVLGKSLEHKPEAHVDHTP